jgi:predicted lipase
MIDEVNRLSKLTGIRNVVTTGHSLGGAMAHLTGMFLAVAGFNVSLQTFGAPRVGNAKFAEFSKKIIPI